MSPTKPSSDARRSSGLRDLHRDNRGAILVFALAGCVALVGALWYVIGIGEALIFREQLQNGADAAAFSSAVYHARAMNMIAVGNLMLASVSTIMASIKVLYATAMTLNLSCQLLRAGLSSPDTVQVCNEATPFIDRARVWNQVEIPHAHSLAQGINATQYGASLGVPWIAESRSAVAAAAGGGHVAFGFSVSPALGGNLLNRDRYGNATDPSPGSAGLPLTTDTPVDTFRCDANDYLGYLDQRERMTTHVIPTMNASGVNPVRWSNYVPRYLNNANAIMCRNAAPDGQYMIQSRLFETRPVHLAANPGTKRVIDGAGYGTDHFGVWGFASGKPELQRQPSKVVEWAGFKRASARIQPFARAANVGYAEAEYYFDPVNDGDRWDVAGPNALWAPRWQARLRRARFTDGAITAKLADSAGTSVATFGDQKDNPAANAAAIAHAKQNGLSFARDLFSSNNLDGFLRAEALTRPTGVQGTIKAIH